MNPKILAEIEHITEYIFADFDKNGKTMQRYPVKSAIIDIIDKLRYILFPGFFETEYKNISELKSHLETLLAEASSQLAAQICLALPHKPKIENYLPKELEHMAGLYPDDPISCSLSYLSHYSTP